MADADQWILVGQDVDEEVTTATLPSGRGMFSVRNPDVFGPGFVPKLLFLVNDVLWMYPVDKRADLLPQEGDAGVSVVRNTVRQAGESSITVRSTDSGEFTIDFGRSSTRYAWWKEIQLRRAETDRRWIYTAPRATSEHRVKRR
ncbi:PH domain-containing protein [Plasmodiophora brassicae]|uniref:Uncharacterized protein n=1 Tax=Plasmodiophora brassicae TaxID=37360 RepID=A0A0G4J6R1_PLABS|nr:hypothetical protein PBRA_003038 [Plasmodiophora brassicae]SPQ95514.1 unnamed protein product [Plasmodiophora brassicae]